MCSSKQRLSHKFRLYQYSGIISLYLSSWIHWIQLRRLVANRCLYQDLLRWPRVLQENSGSEYFWTNFLYNLYHATGVLGSLAASLVWCVWVVPIGLLWCSLQFLSIESLYLSNLCSLREKGFYLGSNPVWMLGMPLSRPSESAVYACDNTLRLLWLANHGLQVVIIYYSTGMHYFCSGCVVHSHHTQLCNKTLCVLML